VVAAAIADVQWIT